MEQQLSQHHIQKASGHPMTHDTIDATNANDDHVEKLQSKPPSSTGGMLPQFPMSVMNNKVPTTRSENPAMVTNAFTGRPSSRWKRSRNDLRKIPYAIQKRASIIISTTPTIPIVYNVDIRWSVQYSLQMMSSWVLLCQSTHRPFPLSLVAVLLVYPRKPLYCMSSSQSL